jgi:hypothetical protein
MNEYELMIEFSTKIHTIVSKVLYKLELYSHDVANDISSSIVSNNGVDKKDIMDILTNNIACSRKTYEVILNEINLQTSSYLS